MSTQTPALSVASRLGSPATHPNGKFDVWHEMTAGIGGCLEGAVGDEVAVWTVLLGGTTKE